MYINAYTTPERIIRQLEKADSGDLPSQADSAYDEFFILVKGYCTEVSDWFTRTVHQNFVPYYEAKTLYINELIADKKLINYRLSLWEPLLEVDSITWIDTAVTSTYYRLRNGYKSQRTPYTVVLFDSAGITWSSGAFDDAITITGWWGYHSNYNQALSAVESVSLADTTTTSLTVADASVYDTYDYLRIEDELVWITARNESTNVLTIERGVNGTTAAAHTSQTAYRVVVQPAVQHALTRFVAWAYDNRSNFGTLQFSDGSVVVQEQPKYVQETIQQFMSHDWVGSI